MGKILTVGIFRRRLSSSKFMKNLYEGEALLFLVRVLDLGGVTSITRKWSIPDAEKDVGIKNVGNKGFPDAVNTVSREESGKHSFPTITKASESIRRKNELKPRGEKRGEAESAVAIFVALPPPSTTLAPIEHEEEIEEFHLEDEMPMNVGFEDDLDNIAGGSSSVGDNTGSSSQQTTPTPRKRPQSRLLELERHVAINGRIPMTIAPGMEKPISPHWANVGREYIEVVKGDLQRLFVIDFNDQAMNRFVEHQMLTTFKEFRTDYHRHFKKYSDPEEACANPPNALVGRDED
ncbi:CACTA en-spm transposon protein [Cucumis melo var. makuwa]|uniref:CACTA en-spm transposon protein n=1 Tax=Cucumis melo var. makuwa TaxID=1194695 RepID=A0A5D3BG91_CUCMM|nr:CACTA en-spm transposon protein [Cucumis melo var. makuwa]